MNLRLTFLFLMLSFLASAQDSLQLNFDTVFARVQANQIPYKTLSERAVLNWDDGNIAQQFNASIRVKRDSVIWMSLSMFGFEGARAFITPDSFRLLNKLSAEYVVKEVSYIRNWISMPVNFAMLQQIIAGEKISIEDKAHVIAREDSAYVLYLESDKMQEKVWVDTVNYTIRKILLKDKLLKQDMTITFDSYNSLSQKPFSYKRGITITRDGQVFKLGMDINRAQADEELSFPFEVSDKYKRVE